MLHSFLAREVGAECCGGSAALLLHETGPTIIGHSESTEPQCHAQYRPVLTKEQGKTALPQPKKMAKKFKTYHLAQGGTSGMT